MIGIVKITTITVAVRLLLLLLLLFADKTSSRNKPHAHYRYVRHIIPTANYVRPVRHNPLTELNLFTQIILLQSERAGPRI
jgi:hypothetical protein